MQDLETTVIALPNGDRFALHRFVGADASSSVPVIVAHGTVSDASSMMPMGRYLTRKGFDVWLLEWGGHGASVVAPRRTFESFGLIEVPAAIASVRKRTGASQVFWVAHSGGGHLPLMHFARFPHEQGVLAGLAILGTQATDAYTSFTGRLQLRTLRALTLLLGHTPGALLQRGYQTEPSCLLAQWAQWNLARAWRGADSFDYLSSLAELRVAALVGAGGADVIAPPVGCKRIFEALGAPTKQWLGPETAPMATVSHRGLVRGRVAEEAIFPRVSEWLRLTAGHVAAS